MRGFPLRDRDVRAAARDERRFTVMARLGHGITLDAAQADLTLTTQHLSDQYSRTNEGWGARAIRLSEAGLTRIRWFIALLATLAGFIVVVACGNVATLYLARGAARTRDVAIRTALGASRWRLVRYALTEAALLALAAGCLGALTASVGLRLASAVMQTTHPLLDELTLDSTVFALTLAVATGTPLLFALLPTWSATRRAPGEAFYRRWLSTADRGQHRRRIFVTFEVALAVVLLVMAGLIAQSMQALRAIELGFHPESVLNVAR